MNERGSGAAAVGGRKASPREMLPGDDRRSAFQRQGSAEEISFPDVIPVAGTPSAKVPQARRDKVATVQRAFLDYRRLLLKVQMVDAHMRDLEREADLVLEIERADKLKIGQQFRLVELEKRMRAIEANYFARGAELSSTFFQMLNYIKLLSEGALNKVNLQLQDVYKQLLDESQPDPPAEQLELLVERFRSFLLLLEDSLMLDKPLVGRQHMMHDKLAALKEMNKRYGEQIAELDDIMPLVSMDCETFAEFTQRSAGITERLQSIQARAAELLPWLQAKDASHGALAECSNGLTAETAYLRPFRDPSFLDRLQASEQEGPTSRNAEMEFSEDGALSYISVDKMLDLIVSGKGKTYSMDFDKVFVTTFRLFLSPQELMNRLMLVYCSTPPPGQEVSGERALAPCRLRILNILKKWIALHMYDFTEDPTLAGLLSRFCDETLKLSGQERFAETLETAIRGTSGMHAVPSQPSAEPVVPLRSDFGLLDLDPLELARQLTLQDQRLRVDLEARDFLNCAWNDKSESVGRSIKAFTQQFNATAEWITGLILQVGDDATRAKYVRFFIAVADHCLRMNSFNGCIKIMASLGGQAIHRLTNTWDRLGKDDMRLYQEMRKLMDQNWAGLRELMISASPPLTVYLGAALGDLTYINEMKTKSSKAMYNFKKLSLTQQAIDRVLQHNDKLFHFTQVFSIMQWITNCENTLRLSPEAAYARSLEIQPRV